ncbi:MAG: cytochrome c biogenesis protein CcdA [Candidatus Eiseniibacteriota bacterium]
MSSIVRRLAFAAVVALAILPAGGGAALAQVSEIPKPQDLVAIQVDSLRVAPGARATARVMLRVRSGWHVNANPAAGESSIPTSLSALADSGVSFGAPQYPPGRIVKLAIDDQPLSLWDGTLELRLPVTANALAKPGVHTSTGKLRFQACNDQLCLPPATVEFRLPIEIIAGAGPGGAASAAGATGDASPSAGGTFAPLTPGAASSPGAAGSAGAGSAAVQTPLAGKLMAGGWLAYLALFVIGLGLNLTPCVYPMLSVTVSIFGARRASSPAHAVFSAVLYVLGMATMYSVLGVVAALTGGLFGGWLSNPWVTSGIGVLLIGMSLSMFGLFQLSLPPALLARMGGAGATSALGIFASGIVVGFFAAPCTGPAVIALLAVVAQKGDPLFGFSAFFTLAMGLGAPYLVLATFSNLLRKLPRSGGWMIWFEKLFGVILFGVGLNYVLLALLPAAASWVLPAALLLAGVWLGFADRSVPKPGFRAFQRVAGVAAIAGGIALLALAPRPRLKFEPLQSESATLAANGQLTLIDFSADWCQPCHELDNLTFTDGRVMHALADFRRLHVDLTHYDSPEAERWRKHYGIGGVPTLVFMLGDGSEVRDARVEGFLPPEAMLERIDQVRAAARTGGATTGSSSPQ